MTQTCTATVSEPSGPAPTVACMRPSHPWSASPMRTPAPRPHRMGPQVSTGLWGPGHLCPAVCPSHDGLLCVWALARASRTDDLHPLALAGATHRPCPEDQEPKAGRAWSATSFCLPVPCGVSVLLSLSLCFCLSVAMSLVIFLCPAALSALVTSTLLSPRDATHWGSVGETALGPHAPIPGWLCLPLSLHVSPCVFLSVSLTGRDAE